MPIIQTCSLPENALLKRYQETGTYTDCYVSEIKGEISHSQYVEAFYTTPLFKLERLLLRVFVARPSTDKEAHELAEGNRDNFAAWNLEARAGDQLLLTDFQGRTRSWLMSVVDTSKNSTCLYFGSAVVPIVDRKTGESRMGPLFSGLLGFHRLYSRALLRLAISRLKNK
jgi:hypothetical protein